jgi:threonine/homoserine/homoserine lactone efflux protein
MYLSLVLKGLLIGLINALPAGPAAVVCLRRTFVLGRRAGMVSGLGMAFADVFYVIIARAGLGHLSQFVGQQRTRLLPMVGVIIIVVGLNILTKKQRLATGNPNQGERNGLFASAFLLSLTNPLMLITIPALFAALGLGSSRFGLITGAVTVASVFSGSIIWWSIATQWVHRSRSAFSDQVVRLGSAVAGTALIILGFVSVSSLLI